MTFPAPTPALAERLPARAERRRAATLIGRSGCSLVGWWSAGAPAIKITPMRRSDMSAVVLVGLAGFATAGRAGAAGGAGRDARPEIGGSSRWGSALFGRASAHALLCQQPASAPAPAAFRAVPRADRNSRLAHEQLLAKAKRGRIDLYFLGDSITRRWGTSDPQYKDFLANWRANFSGWNAGNFGWGGDTVQNVLWRVEQGELDGVNPKVIVLMAGTNNLGNGPAAAAGDDARVEEVVAGTRAILDVARRKAPGATVVLMGITPRNDGRGGTRTVAAIDRANERIARLADGKSVRYLNINGRLADGDGKLFDGVTVDGLHLSVRGYQAWADALRPVLTELLGPPSKTDLAPEPTGDPSAAGR